MGARGPKPKSMRRQELDGEIPMGTVDKLEPKGFAEPPDYLSPDALAVWDHIVASEPPGTFTHADAHTLAAYCVSADMHARAARTLKREGPTQFTDKGREVVSPWFKVLNETQSRMTALASSLGLSPGVRGQLTRNAKRRGRGTTVLENKRDGLVWESGEKH